MYAYEHHNVVIYMQQLVKQRRAMENSTAQKELITFVHNYFLLDEILVDGFCCSQRVASKLLRSLSDRYRFSPAVRMRNERTHSL